MLDTDDDKRKCSWLDSTQARFEAANAALVLKTRALLQSIVPDGQIITAGADTDGPALAAAIESHLGR